ncbi:MAG: hypothetical protein KatS3mg010_0753 [Acidimicrobiia bacterium]|nr:MAG: hypothetical protein KatS3mg010_0753 [Acidimicrobiia bacterium]
MDRSAVVGRRGRVRRVGAALALACLGAAVGIVVGPVPATAAEQTVGSGALDWGVRASFRGYVTGPIAAGSITTADGAVTNADGTFRFPVTGGVADTTGAAADVATGGSVRFTGHGGELDLRISALRVVLAGGTGTLVADVSSKPLEEPEPVVFDDVALAALDLSGVTPAVGSGGVTWPAVPATLTESGAAAFAGFYPAGTPLDPVTLAVTFATGTSTTTAATGPSTTVAPGTTSTTPTTTVTTVAPTSTVAPTTSPATSPAGVGAVGATTTAPAGASTTVAAAAVGAGQGTLPRTGSGSLVPAAVGALCALGGGALRVSARRAARSRRARA